MATMQSVQLKAVLNEDGNVIRVIPDASSASSVDKRDALLSMLKSLELKAETEERHRCELHAAESHLDQPSASDGVAAERERGGSFDDGQGERRQHVDTDGAADALKNASLEDREREKRDQKRAKAQRKREKLREKELERERRIEKEKAEGGPDPRLIEMDALSAQVAPQGLRVREIQADGHCLYRAVAEQLSLTGRREDLSEKSYALMREDAARELRSRPDEYMPFLDEVAGADAFNKYCDKVQDSAEWGGQVELQALCKALEAPIEVYSAAAPPVRLGEEYDGSPLRLSYHEHYYALGAHYNSLAPA